MPYVGLLVAAAAVAVFGVLNLTRSGTGSPGEQLAQFENDQRGQAFQIIAEDTGSLVDSPDPQAPETPAPETEGTPEERHTGTVDEEAPAPTGDGEPPARTRDEEPPAPALAEEAPAPATAVLVLIYGEDQSGYEMAESVVLEELVKRGHEVLDQTSLEIVARAGVGADPAELGRMGRAAGAAILVLGTIRSDATSSVGGFYTGSSRLSVRTYDTATGELLSSETFQVGANNVPGKLGATPAAAVTEAAEQVGYRAAAALSRELRGRSDGS